MPDESTPVDNSDDDDLLSPTPPFAPNFDPTAWRNVCESFIDPLIEELERWLQRRPPADSGTDITDWLVELTYTLYPVALGVGTDESLKRWSRAKVELEACVSLDFADRFEAQIKDMFKATEAVIAEFSQCAPKHESAVIEPFLCVSVEGFQTYLDSCSATLRKRLGLPPRRQSERSANGEADKSTCAAPVSEPPPLTATEGTPFPKQVTKKRSTQKGEARSKLIAALLKHHRYQGGDCLNTEPIGVNELTRLAKVSQGSGSTFFTREFKGHAAYQAICQDWKRLVESLKVLNDDFCPWELYGREPQSPRRRDEE